MRPEPVSPLLERFRLAKRAEIAALEHQAEAGSLPDPLAGPRPAFRTRLVASGGLPAVIAEYKRASPSRGAIATDLNPEAVAVWYAEAGAACISVLTEEVHFQGHLEHLGRAAGPGLPLLRKDFLFHPLQVAQTGATPASALLLIVRLTPEVRLLRALREQAEALGLEAVVEVFDAADLALARDAGATLIQVNARDLETLDVDRSACLRLAEAQRPKGRGETWIAASGMNEAVHLRQVADCGYDAALLGTALMQSGRPGEALRRLLRHSRELPQ